MPSSQSVEVTHNATFTTMVTGVGSNNFTYQWRHNGTIISGETSDIFIITNLVQNDTGTYDCTIMNQYGDSNSSSTSLTVTGSQLIIGQSSGRCITFFLHYKPKYLYNNLQKFW